MWALRGTKRALHACSDFTRLGARRPAPDALLALDHIQRGLPARLVYTRRPHGDVISNRHDLARMPDKTRGKAAADLLRVEQHVVRLRARVADDAVDGSTSLVSNPSSSSGSAAGAFFFMISWRSPGLHLAAQPPFSVMRVRRTQPFSSMGLLDDIEQASAICPALLSWFAEPWLSRARACTPTIPIANRPPACACGDACKALHVPPLNPTMPLLRVRYRRVEIRAGQK